MKINKYDFNGVELTGLESEIRTILVNPITTRVSVEIDIKPENGQALVRENLNFELEDEEILARLIELVSEKFNLSTGKKIEDVSVG